LSDEDIDDDGTIIVSHCPRWEYLGA
jgi:hypothetical protein